MTLITVLKDDSRRIAAMQDITDRQLTDHDFLFFGNAKTLIQWLVKNIDRPQILSLDCDLDATLLTGANCGSGEDVTAFLANSSTDFPVVIHSSNAIRAPAMRMELKIAGWTYVELCPFFDAEQWANDIRRAIKSAQN